MLQLIRVILFLIVGTFLFSSPAQAKDTQEQPIYTIIKKSAFHPGANIVQCKHGHKGVRDKNNTLIIPTAFEEIIDCSFGYASRRNGFWNLTDSQGKSLGYTPINFIPTQHGDYIIEKCKDEFYLINNKAKKLPLPYLTKINVIECGYLIKTRYHWWYLIDPKGVNIIPYVMNEITRKDDLFIAKTQNSDVCVFNTEGKVVVPATDSIKFYENDTIMVTPNAMYSREKTIIPPAKFSSLEVLKGNKCVKAVQNDGTYNGLSGLYSINGKELLSPQLSLIKYFDETNTLLVVKNVHGIETYGIYDFTGKCILPPIYRYIDKLRNVGYQFTSREQIAFFWNDSGTFHIQTHRIFR